MKVNNFTIAKRYVNALFEVAREHQVIDIIEKDFSILRDTLTNNPTFFDFIMPQVMPSKMKQMFLNTLLSEIKLHPMTANTLNLLIKHNRVAALTDIIKQFFIKASELREEEQAYIEVAEVLSEEKYKEIQQQLEQIFHKKIVLNIDVKPEILGGMMIRVGDRMLDNTIRGKLEDIKRIALR